MKLKTFEDFQEEFETPDEHVEVADVDQDQEAGFYWVEFDGKMTIAEWINDDSAGENFWLAHGEQDPIDSEVRVIQAIEPPLDERPGPELWEPTEGDPIM